ncbi:MAG: hypothetical protein WBP46_10825 [Thiolinea sp.]
MQAIKTKVSRDDYLQLDETNTEKHEFHQGQLFAMAGGTCQALYPTTNS